MTLRTKQKNSQGTNLDTAPIGLRTVPDRSGLADVKTPEFSRPPRPRDMIRAGTARALGVASSCAQAQGSVLLLTLLTAWVIGIALVSYLTLVANQNRSTYRSLTWNACVPVMEAGVEEALTQLYYNDISQLGNNQWTYSDGLYHKTSYLGDDGSKYHVTIEPVDPPVIVSTGYCPAPANTGIPLGGQTAFGMILGTGTGLSTPALISRTLRVTTKRIRPGDGGIQSKGRINLSGPSWLDSFDSTNPQESTNGKYDPAKRTANGLALSNSTEADAVHVGSGHVFGRVTSGPGPLTGLDATVTYTSGAVGDTAWNAGNSGVKDGHASNDANVQFNDVTAPFTWGSGLNPISGDGPDGTNYNWVVGPGNNQLATVNISGGKKMIVTGDATLYVNGNFNTSGTGYVYVAPGASLKLYISGTGSFSGTGIINGSGFAKNFSVYGLPTCTSFSYSGSSAFIGTVYAPSADFSFSGNAGAFGSFAANTVTVSGGAHVAYDKGLNALGRYVANSWNEI